MKTQAPAIALIEKDEVTLEIYQRELNKSFTVFAFLQINGVLETIAHQEIQAVVIEPEIQSGQGWELIHSIRAAFPERRIPIIICSTRDTSSKGPARDVTLYLTKPVLPKTLRESTLSALRKKEEMGKPS